jgi:hypothetical protein
MKEDILRFVLDIFYTGCYLFLTHTGYNISDKISSKEDINFLYIVAWLIASVVIFLLTKQRYDKEVEEGNEEQY